MPLVMFMYKFLHTGTWEMHEINNRASFMALSSKGVSDIQ